MHTRRHQYTNELFLMKIVMCNDAFVGAACLQLQPLSQSQGLGRYWLVEFLVHVTTHVPTDLTEEFRHVFLSPVNMLKERGHLGD
jgi:hypothetical protein